tara:strand:+ start:1319 stop:1468 length:150 start_codon:yes stop_codon:yes gene_type:complete
VHAADSDQKEKILNVINYESMFAGTVLKLGVEDDDSGGDDTETYQKEIN